MRDFCSLILIFAVAISVARGSEPPASGPRTDTAPPEATRYIPDDAGMVIVIPDLAALTKGLAAFGRGIGDRELAGIQPGPLVEEMLGMQPGIAPTRGPLVLAISKARTDPVIIIANDSDRRWPPAQTKKLENGFVLHEFGGNQVLAATNGRLTIFARHIDDIHSAIRSKGKLAQRIQRSAGQALTNRHLVLYADVQAWTDEINARLRTFMEGMYVGMAASGPDAGTAMRVWDWVFSNVRQMVAEARTFVATMTLDAEGVFADSCTTFSAQGSVAQHLRQIRKPNRDLLRGLPAGSGAVVFGFEWENSSRDNSINEAFSKLVAQSLEDTVERQQLDAIVERSRRIDRSVTGNNGVFTLCPESGGMLYWGLYLTPDGRKVRDEIRDLCAACPEALNAWGNFPCAMQRDKVEMVGNVKTDVYAFNAADAAMTMQPMVRAVYGEDPTLFMAEHREGVAYAFGSRKAARRQLETLVSHDRPLRDEARVGAVLERMSPHPQVCMLADFEDIFRIGTTFIERMGMPAPTLPQNSGKAPYAGLALYIESEALRAEVFIPAEPLRNIIDAMEEYEAVTGGAY